MAAVVMWLLALSAVAAACNSFMIAGHIHINPVLQRMQPPVVAWLLQYTLGDASRTRDWQYINLLACSQLLANLAGWAAKVWGGQLLPATSTVNFKPLVQCSNLASCFTHYSY